MQLQGASQEPGAINQPGKPEIARPQVPKQALPVSVDHRSKIGSRISRTGLAEINDADQAARAWVITEVIGCEVAVDQCWSMAKVQMPLEHGTKVLSGPGSGPCHHEGKEFAFQILIEPFGILVRSVAYIG
jgi:hypothetical protein